MSAPSLTHADRAELARKAWARQLLQRQADMLGELAEIGLQIARDTGRRAADANDHPPEDPAADQLASHSPIGDGPVRANTLAMAYARAARAVRLTLMLQAKVIYELRRLDAPAPPRFLGAAPLLAPEDERKARVQRIVQRVARTRHGEDEAEIDRLMNETGERLDDEDLYRDIAARPLGELVACICRDLGLDPDWAGLAQEPWARDELDDPRSPFSAMTGPAAVRALRPAQPHACSP